MAVTLISTLHVERAGSKVRFRLEVPEQDVEEPLQQEVSLGLDEQTLEVLRNSAGAVLGMAEGPTFEHDALARGQVLYRSLVPPGLREALKEIARPLLVSTSLHGVPWELLHDGEEFWGLRYALGNRLITERPSVRIRTRPPRRRPRALVIASDPRGDLPFVRDEGETIATLLADLIEVRLVAGPVATFETVTTYLREGYDLIHFCGHVVRGREGDSALLLADEEQLTATVIERNLQERPLVFLNGCASTRGVAGHGNVRWEEDVSSAASAFLFGGAIGVVGTLGDVGDRSSADLAREFYLRILDSLSTGEALRLARAGVRSRRPSSPAWLSFVLYGNPSHVLVDGSPARTQARIDPRPPEAPQGTSISRRGLLWASATIAALTGAAIATRVRFATAPSKASGAAPLVVGVMEIRDPRGNVPRWMRELTRDGLNTIFSKVDGLRVYSKQKIDFLKEKRGLSEIEVADALGMTKMILPTLAATDSSVQIDVEIVDIGSGLLEAFESVYGTSDQLVELQNQIALRTLEVLELSLSTAEIEKVLAYRTNETLDNYKLLAETLPAAPGGSDTPPPQDPDPDRSWLLGTGEAYAADDGDDTAIRALLREYQDALQAKSLERLAQLQVQMNDTQRQALARYFENAANLKVTISNVDLLIEGNEALATFTREDDFTDAPSGRPMRLEVRTEQRLVRTDAGWRILAMTQAE